MDCLEGTHLLLQVVYLRNHPGISQGFFWILFCKAVPGVGGTDLAGVFKDNEPEGESLRTGGEVKKVISSTLEVCIRTSERVPVAFTQKI